MKIAIDCDMVLNDHEAAWAKWIADQTGKPFDLATLTRWGCWHEVCELGERAYDFLDLPGSFESLNPRPGAVEAVAQLHHQGHELFVVSAVRGHDFVEKQRWLARHFPLIPPKHFIACHAKGMLRCDALVDDGIHNHEGFHGLRILFDQPWNRPTLENVDALARITRYFRAFNWGEVVGLVSTRSSIPL